MKPQRDPEMATASSLLPESKAARAFVARFALYVAMQPAISWAPDSKWGQNGRQLYYTDAAWADSYLELGDGGWELTGWDWEPGDHPDPVDPEAPWDHSVMRYAVAPFVSDDALVAALADAVSPAEPLSSEDPKLLARKALNAATDPTTTPDALAQTLRAWMSHFQTSPLSDEVVAESVARVGAIWADLLPGPRPLQPGPEGTVIVAHGHQQDTALEAENLRLVVGWALRAMGDAAQGSHAAERRYGFDATGLWCRTAPYEWAHLIGLRPDRLVLMGNHKEGAQRIRSDAGTAWLSAPDPERRTLPTPGWVPTLLVKQLATRMSLTGAWTQGGRWFRGGRALPGPESLTLLERTLGTIQPDRSPDLAAAFATVSPPATAAARDEVLAMMAGLDDFLAGRGVLAPRSGGATSVAYPERIPSPAAAADAPPWALRPFLDEQHEWDNNVASSALMQRMRVVTAVRAVVTLLELTGPAPAPIDVDLRHPSVADFATAGEDVVISAQRTQWQVAAVMRAAAPQLAADPTGKLREALDRRLAITLRDLDRVTVGRTYAGVPQVALGRLAEECGRQPDGQALGRAVAVFKDGLERAEALRLIPPSWT